MSLMDGACDDDAGDALRMFESIFRTGNPVASVCVKGSMAR